MDFVPIALFSGLENGVGVTCACLPSLRGLFGRLLSQSAKTDQGARPPPLIADSNDESMLKSPVHRYKGGMSPKIKATTAIQQTAVPAQLGPYVPLDELDLGTRSHGYVEATAWK